MTARRLALVCVAAFWLYGPAGAIAAASEAETFFELKIRPTLAGTCFRCHGGARTENDLRVDSREALIAGGASGPAIVPGAPQDSLLLHAIRYGDMAVNMPPDARLAAEVVADFERWIAGGAVWPADDRRSFQGESHWAFQPVARVTPPSVGPEEPAHPIDRFIEARLREHNVQPVAVADRRTLIRRLSFDLVGLPPTPEDVAAFVADPDSAAYEELVDRLLASPQYGERWGRYWMDLVRYADTAGDNADYPVPEARLYRDYIIDSFNADLPYDQFVAEQLAGDLLAKADPGERFAQQIAATGFLALSRRYGTAPGELWHLTLEDTIDATGRALLGLTLRCARCHDHKFDPVTTSDYYALYGIFASTKFPYAGSEEFQSKSRPRADFVPLVAADVAAPQIAAWRQSLVALDEQIAAMEKSNPKVLALAELERKLAAAQPNNTAGGGELADVDALRKDRNRLKKEVGALLNPLRDEVRRQRRWGAPLAMPLAYAVSEGTPVDEAIHVRGEPAQRGEVVPRNVPAVLRGSRPFAIAVGASGRLELARWLTAAENPLTARVIVNRVWQHHFGRGIVETPSNFGLRGAPPTHPELLDWLAGRFVTDGWSLKRLHRLIVTSAAYQRSSQTDPASAAIDPENQLLWRYERRRLDAEAIRDALLFVAGRLDSSRDTGQPFPPVTDWNWTQHAPFRAVYESNRRAVYLMTQRIQRHPLLALFDGPDTNSSTDTRTSATVPLQALFWLNSPLVRQQADALAERVQREASDEPSRIGHLYEIALSRPATNDEVARAGAYLDEAAAAIQATGATADDAQRQAWASLARLTISSNEFLYVD